MAMSGGKDDGSPMMEMNTTPLIDVMLVLLIMFIITIPIQTHAVKVDLPVPDNNPTNAPDPIKNKIYISPEGAILWNGQTVNFTQLADLLNQTSAMQPAPELQLEPDAQARERVLSERRQAWARPAQKREQAVQRRRHRSARRRSAGLRQGAVRAAIGEEYKRK